MQNPSIVNLQFSKHRDSPKFSDRKSEGTTLKDIGTLSNKKQIMAIFVR